MAATIDATVGGASANSYAATAAADAYFETRPNSTNWSGAVADLKTRALITATGLIDPNPQWDPARIGTNRATVTQALLFPMANTLNLIGDAYYALTIIPPFVLEGTYETAMALIAGDRLVDPDSREFESLTLGPLGLKYNTERAGRYRPLPDAALNKLAPWLLVDPGASPRLMRTVPIVR